jgi:hypothetical protein
MVSFHQKHQDRKSNVTLDINVYYNACTIVSRMRQALDFPLSLVTAPDHLNPLCKTMTILSIHAV